MEIHSASFMRKAVNLFTRYETSVINSFMRSPFFIAGARPKPPAPGRGSVPGNLTGRKRAGKSRI
jgi:hypothetical protein